MTIEFRHILVPIDFGESSQKALDTAIDLVGRLGSQLTLVHIYEIPSYVYEGVPFATADFLTPIEHVAREHLEKVLRSVQVKVPNAKAILRQGAAASEILSVVAQSRPDIVVMGTRGRKGIRHAFLGSVAEKVVRFSAVPVLTLRGPSGQE